MVGCCGCGCGCGCNDGVGILMSCIGSARLNDRAVDALEEASYDVDVGVVLVILGKDSPGANVVFARSFLSSTILYEDARFL